MDNREFWQAVYLALIKAGYGPYTAQDMADEAVKGQAN